MAKKSGIKHLGSQANYRFALSAALVAILLALLISLVNQLGTIMSLSSQARYP
jgi:hypothetical protein